MKQTKVKHKINIVFSIIFIVSISLNISMCKTDNDATLKDRQKYTGNPKIEFNKTTHDFGNLKDGEIVECTFIYKNTGTSPLKILSVVADCGCTIPEYSNTEIFPGDKGKIKVIFNSKGFKYNIYKTIDVETNIDSTYIELILTAYIENKLN